MRLADTKSIRAALKEAERSHCYNLYIQLDEADRKDTWVRVFRVRNRRNRGTGETYVVVETMGGSYITLRGQHGNFDIR